ncbi:arsenate reductase (glutaredoxin) [Sphingomonas sp. HHU CXW]|uniref:Arsenate reductase (Glutaredoxin) n=1 Tax=Sphingomonas hominis TaxID=2741495 RepID=A0ABX2JEX8_9SPHN|nr:ArsC/Spx/MgsR family protein [Sphingomonas hominis]NTS65060.1 arsenate reductase (glutaredoxin) [Sphingomonas hominis]
MKATILHNPRCSKSREALAILHETGAEVSVIDYLEHPPTRNELARLYARAGVSPRDGLRKDAPKVANDAAALDLMVLDPSTIERPLVGTDKGVRLCRPPSAIKDVL